MVRTYVGSTDDDASNRLVLAVLVDSMSTGVCVIHTRLLHNENLGTSKKRTPFETFWRGGCE